MSGLPPTEIDHSFWEQLHAVEYTQDDYVETTRQIMSVEGIGLTLSMMLGGLGTALATQIRIFNFGEAKARGSNN